MNEAKRHIVLAVTLAEQGGVQAFLLCFARYLMANGHTVTLIAGQGSWLFEACAKEGITAHKLTHMQRAVSPWADLQAILELHRLFRALKPDALHVNSTKMGTLGSLAARTASTPRIVYRIGGWTFLEPLSPVVRFLYRAAERISARWKDIIVCVHPGDEAVARSLSIVPRESIVTIPNGIDLAAQEAQILSQKYARDTLGIQAETFVFGTIANLFPAKDLPRYLEACARVYAKHPHTRFVIIGEGMERAAIEKARQEFHLENAVILPGAIEQASHLLRGFDTFVLPSAKEGMSWALLEAMAASLPCIATDAGANAWLLQNAGWIVPAQDPQTLAQTMEEVLKHPLEAQKRGRHAYERVARDFPLEKTLRENAETLLLDHTRHRIGRDL